MEIDILRSKDVVPVNVQFIPRREHCAHYKDPSVNAVKANDHCYVNQRKRAVTIIYTAV